MSDLNPITPENLAPDFTPDFLERFLAGSGLDLLSLLQNEFSTALQNVYLALALANSHNVRIPTPDPSADPLGFPEDQPPVPESAPGQPKPYRYLTAEIQDGEHLVRLSHPTPTVPHGIRPHILRQLAENIAKSHDYIDFLIGKLPQTPPLRTLGQEEAVDLIITLEQAADVTARKQAARARLQTAVDDAEAIQQRLGEVREGVMEAYLSR
jgi:hypothetical protein